MNRPMHGGNLAWAAALAGCPPDAIVDFSASISPLGPPESAIAAIATHLQYLRAYPDPDYLELRASIAAAHHLTPDWILPGNGCAELLTWAAWDLSQLAATCLVTPAFGDYWRALQAFDAKVLKWPLSLVGGEWLLEGEIGQADSKPVEQDPIANALPLHNQKLTTCGLLLNNPHNPTGKLFSQATIRPILEQFGLVVVDEAFMDFVPPDQEQSLIRVVQDYPNLVILRSLTKFYSLPGLRLGYAIAHPDRLRCWQQRRDPWPVNVLAAAAAVAAIQDTQFGQQTWDWLAQVKPQLFQGLAELPGLNPYPGAANFLLVQSTQPSSLVQQKLLLSRQILIRDCLSFPELGDRYFRVAVRSYTDNQRLIQALAEVL